MRLETFGREVRPQEIAVVHFYRKSDKRAHSFLIARGLCNHVFAFLL